MTDFEKLELLKKEIANKEYELAELKEKRANWDYEIKQKKYRDKFNCANCRYSAVMEIGDHTECAGGSCTCCHHDCENYCPDNEYTILIKSYTCTNHWRKNTPYYLSKPQYDAFRTLTTAFLIDDENLPLTCKPNNNIARKDMAYNLLKTYLDNLVQIGVLNHGHDK